jgi:hypothetical protein
VIINNEAEVTPQELRTKLIEYLDLVTGRTPRYASPVEIFMNVNAGAKLDRVTP